MAACDAKYRFILVDIGAFGSSSDGAVFQNSVFGNKFDSDEMSVPRPSKLKGTREKIQFFFVADEAFPLKQYIMRPFPGLGLNVRKRIFNYRLSRARRIIENSFGILVARWRVFLTPIDANLESVEKMIGACVCLHNFLMADQTRYNSEDADTVNVLATSIFEDITKLSSNNAKKRIIEIRESLSYYFMTKFGAVSWQFDQINKGCQ